MVAAEIMSAIYFALLQRMKADNFRVFERQYQLSMAAKLAHPATVIEEFLNAISVTSV